MPLPEKKCLWQLTPDLTPEETAKVEAHIAERMAWREGLFRRKPHLMNLQPIASDEQRELARQQQVRLFSSNPLYQNVARESGNEQEFWRNFYNGIVLPKGSDYHSR